MAVPKRRKSKAMRDHRRAQWMRSVAIPSASTCSNCHEPKLPHRICAHCGHYGDQKILDVKSAEE